jgi:hypothetical protein
MAPREYTAIVHTPINMACVVCGYPVSWHRNQDNRQLTCVELMMAYGVRTTVELSVFLRGAADEKRTRGLKRLEKHNRKITKRTTPRKRSKRAK